MDSDAKKALSLAKSYTDNKVFSTVNMGQGIKTALASGYIADLYAANMYSGKYISNLLTVSTQNYAANAIYNCTKPIYIGNYNYGDTITFRCPVALNANVLYAYKTDGTGATNKWVTNVTSGLTTGITWDSSTSIATMDVMAFCTAYNVAYVAFNFLASVDNFLNYNTNVAKTLGLNVAPKLNLLSKYNLIVGTEFNLYNDQFICDNASRQYTVSWSYTGDNGQAFDKRFRIVPSVAGDFTLTVNIGVVINGVNTVVAIRAISIHVIATQTLSTQTNVIFLGDSRTNSDYLVSSIKTLIGTNLNLLGTMTDTAGNHHEGRNGWAAQHYCTASTYNGKTNPFYNPSYVGVIANTSTPSYFDFAYYMTQQGYVSVDTVNILLGANDGFNTGGLYAIETIVNNIKAYNSNIKITIMMEYVSPLSSYQIDAKSRRLLQYAFFDMVLGAFGNRESEGIYLVPIYVNIDNVNDFLYTDQAVSAANPTIEHVILDIVHPAQYGYYKMRDIYYSVFFYIF